MAISGYIAGAMSDYLIKSGYSITSVRKISQVKSQSHMILLQLFHYLFTEELTNPLASITEVIEHIRHLFAIDDVLVMIWMDVDKRILPAISINIGCIHIETRSRKNRDHICCLNLFQLWYLYLFYPRSRSVVSLKIRTKNIIHDLKYFISFLVLWNI